MKTLTDSTRFSFFGDGSLEIRTICIYSTFPVDSNNCLLYLKPVTREELESLRQQEYVGSAELAEAAARLIGELVPVQEKGSVAEVPDARTVRYYLSEGLISPASERRGTASLYGYRQLLELLAVKRLQADYLPIRKIRELIENRTESELEQMLGMGGEPRSNPALDYLNTLSERSMRPPSADLARSMSLRHSAPEMAPAWRSASREPSSLWTRIEVESGLELHVRNDYQPPVEAKERRRLTRRLLQEISARRRRNEPDTED
jgi:DNA-binding transcriptional MerR regulator